MKKLLDSYLQQNGLNRSDVVRATGINTTTVLRSADREADEINPRVTFAVAETLHKMPGQVLGEIIEMEMKNDMTTTEVKLLLIKVLDDVDATALVTVEDMGEDSEAIIAEIDLPSKETIRFAVNNSVDETITRYDVLNDLAFAMNDYDHEEDGEFFPTQRDEGEITWPLIDVEYMGLSKPDADYLSNLSDKIMKLRK